MSDIQVEGAESTESVPVKTVKPEQFPARGARGWVKLGALVLLGFVLWTWTRPTHPSQADLLRSVRRADRQITVMQQQARAICQPTSSGSCALDYGLAVEIEMRQNGTESECLRDLVAYNLSVGRIVLPRTSGTDCKP